MKSLSKKHGWLFACILILAFVLAACGGSETTSEPIEAPFANTYWQLESYTLEETGQVHRIPDSTVVIYYGEDGGIFGFSGCNFVTGSYNISGEMITINAGNSTTYICPDPTILAQEAALLGVLTVMGAYTIEGESMELSNPNGVEEVQLTQITPPPPLAGTEWVLDSYNDGQGALVVILDGTEITAAFAEDGTLGGSAGCNNYNTTYEVDGNNIVISSPMALTLKMCETPDGVMDQETQYLGALENSSVYYNLVAALVLLDDNNDPTAFYLRPEDIP